MRSGRGFFYDGNFIKCTFACTLGEGSYNARTTVRTVMEALCFQVFHVSVCLSL